MLFLISFSMLGAYRLVRIIPVNYENQLGDCSGPIFDARGLKYIPILGCIGPILAFMMFNLCEEYYLVILEFSLLGGARLL